MEHLTPQEIMDLPHLGAAARARADAHLAACPTCRCALQAHQQTWDALDGWSAPKSPDHTASILSALRQAKPASWLPGQILQIAASLAVTGTLGVAAAWWSVPRPAASTEEVALALHLQEFAPADDPLVMLTDGENDPTPATEDLR